MKIKLLGNEKSAILKRYTDDFDVYDLYLKALSNIQLATSEGFERASEYLGQTLKIDPLFVPGFHGLAEMYILSSFFGNVPPNTAYPKAKEYAEKVLELDNMFSDTHRIMAVVSTYYDWDWEAAEHHFKYAIELNPSNEWVHFSYSWYLIFMDRSDEAISEAKRAVELDPLSSFFTANLGHIYTFALQFEKAIIHHKQTLTMAPNLYLGHVYLGIAYYCVSKMDEAIKEFRKAVELYKGGPFAVAFLAIALYENGDKEESEKLMRSLELRSEKEYVPATYILTYYLLKGDYDQAYKLLEQAIQEHDVILLHNIAFPIKKVRIPYEPRFAELMKKVGLKRYFQNDEEKPGL